MPFDKDGRIDPEAARRWLAEHLDPSRVSRVSPRPSPGEAASLLHAHGYLAAAERAICAAPVLVAIFGADAGLTRATADRLADLMMLAMWYDLSEAATMAGFLRDPDDLVLPASAADWRERLDWSALFDEAGAPRREPG